MNNGDVCRERAAPAGSTFYYCALFQPEADRPRLYALLFLYLELSELLFKTTDTGVSRTSLAWWADEIERYARAESRHPLTGELAQIDPGSTLAGPLYEAVAACNKLLDYTILPGYPDWMAAHRCRVEPLARIMATTTPASGEALLQSATVTLAVHSVLEQLHQGNRMLAAGRPLVPQELLLKHGLDNEHLRQDNSSPRVLGLFRDVFATLLDDLASSARPLLANDTGQYNFMRSLNAMLQAQCREYHLASRSILRQHIALSPLRKLWLAWRHRRRN